MSAICISVFCGRFQIPVRLEIQSNRMFSIYIQVFYKSSMRKIMLISYFLEKQQDSDVSSAIRNSLSASLNNGTHNGLNSLSGESTSLQSQLAASSKLALISPVDYEEVNNFNNNSVQDLKSKYIVLKPQTSSQSSTTTGSNASATITSNCSNINGKNLVNGLTTDKINNGTGNNFILNTQHSVYFHLLDCL